MHGTTCRPGQGRESQGGRITSPASKLRQSLNESISASKLYRDLSPQKVFAGKQAHFRTSLPDLFKQKGGLQSLRPTYLTDPQSGDYDDGTKSPKLLSRWVNTLLSPH